eukprot:8541580-Alexandrium_andersonii.AAC.1
MARQQALATQLLSVKFSNAPVQTSAGRKTASVEHNFKTTAESPSRFGSVPHAQKHALPDPPISP